MSRLAKKPIIVSAGVTVREEKGAVIVRGPLGEKSLKILPLVAIRVEGENIFVDPQGESAQSRANAGTMWSLIKNAVRGTAVAFLKILEIEGVGYRAALEGDTIVLFLGYVNPIRVKIPSGVAVEIEKNAIKISGTDKDIVSRTAATIRAFKKPEPYKGKGIRYRGEIIKRKVGKKAGATTGAAA